MSSERSRAETHWRHIKRLVDEFDFETRILRFIADLYGPEAIVTAWQEFWDRDIAEGEQTSCDFRPNSPFAKLFVSWLAHNWKPEDDGEGELASGLQDLVPTEAFLEHHPEIDSLLYRYLETCTYAPFSFYEVVRCDFGRAVMCRDILVGRQYEAFEGGNAEKLKQGEIMYARLVEIDGIAVLDAVAPVTFPAVLKPRLVAFRDSIFMGASLPTEIGASRQLLEDLQPELRKAFWNLVYLLGASVCHDQCYGSDGKPRLH